MQHRLSSLHIKEACTLSKKKNTFTVRLSNEGNIYRQRTTGAVECQKNVNKRQGLCKREKRQDNYLTV